MAKESPIDTQITRVSEWIANLSYDDIPALITKMAVVAEHRKSLLAPLMVACLEYYIFAPRKYRHAFVVLKGRHCLNENFYQKLTGAERVAAGWCFYGEQIVLIMDRRSAIYQNVRKSILAPLVKDLRREE